MAAGMYPQAIALLDKRINENPTDAEAHFQLGICYINRGNYSGADERFRSAVRLKPDYGYQIGKEWKKAADFAFKKRKLTEAKTLFVKGIEYDPRIKKQGYNFFVNLGDNATGSKAVEFYEMALKYTQGNKELREKIEYRFLKIAANEWPSTQCETLKKRAAKILGQAKLNEVFPGPQITTIFEKTYTDADIDKNGYIYTFTWGDRYKKGDFIEIIGEIPGQKKLYAKEIYYYRGKHCTPDWGKTDNGYRKIPINYPPENGKFVIWIEKGKGIEARVKVSRKVTPKPNLALINRLIN